MANHTLFAFILSITTLRSLSCVCDTIAFEEAVEWADEIFVGSVIKAEVIDAKEYVFNRRWKYTFQVTEKWKGSSHSVIEIYHEGSSCDPYFDIYQTEYLIYASEYDGRAIYGELHDQNPAFGHLYTWLCARNIEKENYLESSWFDTDTRRLDTLFPDKIPLNERNLLQLILVFSGFGLGAMLLIVIGRGIRNTRNNTKTALKHGSNQPETN